MHTKATFFGFLACLITFLALLQGTAAIPTSTSTSVNLEARPKDVQLGKRQSVVQGTVCANVPIKLTISLISYTLIDGICLCTEAGVLTPDSILRLDAQISAGNSLVGGVINIVSRLVGGLTNLLGLARTAGQDGVNATPATCAYPANSTPQCPGSSGSTTLPGTTCSFTCDTGYRGCGSSYCIASTQQCVSGIPSRRGLFPAVSDSLCPEGLTACYTSSFASLARGRSVSWECVDTGSDMESCGGCLFPVPSATGGQGVQGEDCTAAQGVDQVSCVRGACEALSCMRGYKLNGTACAVDGSMKSFWGAI